jgi:hypothetical protein
MGKFKTSLDLFKRSLSVIAQNRTLLLFPVITLGFIFIIVLFFISPFALSNTGHALTDPLHWKTLADRIKILAQNKEIVSSAARFAWFAGVYLASIFMATFFNVAFYNEILHALNGNKVSISRGIGAAWSKIKLILIWSLFAGVVGIIIKILEDKLSFVGQWIMRFIGFSWSVASTLIIPVIIREKKSSNPVNLLKTSALMLHRTWGEAVIGYIGIGSAGFLIILLTIIPFFIISMVVIHFVMLGFWAIFAALSLALIGLIALSFLWSVVGDIYRCALYVYASEGVVPGPFDEEMMNMCWKVKSDRKEAGHLKPF